MQFQEHARFSFDSLPDAPPEGDRWSTWDGAMHGPTPRPDWVITALGAVESDVGILKTGKEADVHLVRRWLPAPEGSVCSVPVADTLLAAKRFRSHERKLFHRDAAYVDGRRVRRSREMRAMKNRTHFGREVLSAQWAGAEFEALGTLWQLGMPVPYPVQFNGIELLMEFIGSPEGEAAPRLAQARPAPALLADLFEQLRAAMLELALHGWTHGDLSPYNVLLHENRLVLIDWPQIVDIIGNPHGPEFLERDARNMCDWFTRVGLEVDHGELFGDLMAAATSRW
jgi:RIO kinase 1